ncbi:hypothetical protein [Paenibacillus prosopidis]|uniref:Flp pilus assembly protein TadB n=1 Tax=Paenibacillus prosopidis TaxID=630520 RepID=A0A368VJW9_9BACL|nr:hypothetical protein [Paenibacillus prosopidis]RCW41654.1 hypothetical protein DFP97_12290 [Paenibacillus prosopidis]
MIFILLKGLIYLGSTIITSYAVYLILKGALTSLNKKIEVENRMKKNAMERKNVHLGIVKDVTFLENIYRDLDNMLMITKKNYQKTSSVQNFVIYHLVMFGILSIFIGGLSHSYLFGGALAVLFVYGNFMRYRVKLRKLRIDRGYQLAELTGAIASTYNSSLQPQMKITLREVVKENPDSPFKKQLQEIIRIDQNYVNPEELMIGIDSFVYSINTSFARELGFTIYKALTTKEFVGDTLTRIDAKIHQNILDIKNETAEKTDVKNLSWFHLIAFPGTFLILALFLNITDESILHYQFQTAQGRAGFLLSVLFIGMARVVASWFLRQPNDY